MSVFYAAYEKSDARLTFLPCIISLDAFFFKKKNNFFPPGHSEMRLCLCVNLWFFLILRRPLQYCGFLQIQKYFSFLILVNPFAPTPSYIYILSGIPIKDRCSDLLCPQILRRASFALVFRPHTLYILPTLFSAANSFTSMAFRDYAMYQNQTPSGAGQTWEGKV